MIYTDNLPRTVTNGNVNTIGSSQLDALTAKCDEVGTVGENGSGWIIKKFINIFIEVRLTNITVMG